MRCPECSGVGIAATYKLDPENHKVGVRVSPAHISDQWDFIYRGGMLVRLMVRLSSKITEGFNGVVVAPFPVINVLCT